MAGPSARLLSSCLPVTVKLENLPATRCLADDLQVVSSATEPVIPAVVVDILEPVRV